MKSSSFSGERLPPPSWGRTKVGGDIRSCLAIHPSPPILPFPHAGGKEPKVSDIGLSESPLLNFTAVYFSTFANRRLGISHVFYGYFTFTPSTAKPPAFQPGDGGFPESALPIRDTRSVILSEATSVSWWRDFAGGENLWSR